MRTCDVLLRSDAPKRLRVRYNSPSGVGNTTCQCLRALHVGSDPAPSFVAHYVVVKPALLEALTPVVRESLRRKAIKRMAGHFGEDERMIEAMVKMAIG